MINHDCKISCGLIRDGSFTNLKFKDVSPGETSLAARSKEKRLYSQATQFVALRLVKSSFWFAPAVDNAVTLSLLNLPIQDKRIKGVYLLLNLA